MINHLLIQSYLKNTLSVASYQVWLYHPIEQKWLYVDPHGVYLNEPSFVLELPSLRLDNILTIDYPQNYKAAVIFLDGKEMQHGNDENLYYFFYPLYSHFAMKSKELETEKLIEGLQNITASLDLDELLTKILDNVAAVVPGAKTSAFWLYNPAIDRLVCKAYRGWKDEIKQVQYKVGESVTGKTYRDGKARVFHSFRKANEAMKGTSKQNYQLLKKAFHNGKVQASVTVPVNFHDEITGVLSIHQDADARSLTKWDLQLIKALAAQISIAIENARLFAEIKRKNQVLVKRNEVHATLTNLSLQNKGVGAIAKELNRMITPPLVFVDLVEEEYYPKKQKKYFTIEELTKLIGSRNIPFNIDLFDIEEKTFYIYPIYVGSICSGCLVVLKEPSLNQLERMIVERGGVFLALEMAKRHSITEVYYKKMHYFYQELLKTENTQQLYKQGLDFGIDLKLDLATIIVEFANFHDLKLLEGKVHQFVWYIKQKLSEPNSLVFGNHNKVNLLLSFNNPKDFPTVIQKINSLLTQWQQNEKVNLYAGIGRMHKGNKAILKSHNEAEKALTYLLTCQTPGIIQYKEIGINRLFLHHSIEELHQFAEEIFSPLQESNPELVETLFEYIRYNRSAAKTAATLHIHINTLYQRLKRIEGILDVSLEDPENILKIQLACHLKETYI